MSGESFTIDTNMMVYSIDTTAGDRHTVARDVVDLAIGSSCIMALQAFSEFYAAVTRKGRLAPELAAGHVRDWLEVFPSVAPTASAIRTALAVAVGRRASYWDALLVATVAEQGCTAILTEDMRGGGTLLGVRIINPFGPDGLTAAARRVLEA